MGTRALFTKVCVVWPIFTPPPPKYMIRPDAFAQRKNIGYELLNCNLKKARVNLFKSLAIPPRRFGTGSFKLFRIFFLTCFELSESQILHFKQLSDLTRNRIHGPFLYLICMYVIQKNHSSTHIVAFFLPGIRIGL